MYKFCLQDHLYMHLTNYSVNRHSNLFDHGDDNGETGSKRSLKYLFDHLNRNNIDSGKVWKSIQVKRIEYINKNQNYFFVN